MGKKENNNQEGIVIPASAIDKIMELWEKAIDNDEERKEERDLAKKIRNEILQDEGAYIRKQLMRIKNKMDNAEVDSPEYEKARHVYEKFIELVRWW